LSSPISHAPRHGGLGGRSVTPAHSLLSGAGPPHDAERLISQPARAPIPLGLRRAPNNARGYSTPQVPPPQPFSSSPRTRASSRLLGCRTPRSAAGAAEETYTPKDRNAAAVGCSGWILMKALVCEDGGGTQRLPSHSPDSEAFMRCYQPPADT